MLPLNCDDLWAAVHSVGPGPYPTAPPAALPYNAVPLPCPIYGRRTPELTHRASAPAAHTVIEIHSQDLLAGWPGSSWDLAASLHRGADVQLQQLPRAAPSDPLRHPATLQQQQQQQQRPAAAPRHHNPPPALLTPGQHRPDQQRAAGSRRALPRPHATQPAAIDAPWEPRDHLEAAGVADAPRRLGPHTPPTPSSSSTGSRSSSPGGLARVLSALRLNAVARLAEHLARARTLDAARSASDVGGGAGARPPPRRLRIRSEAAWDMLTYDELLALDQFNVKRGVTRAAVMRLPSRPAGGCDGGCEAAPACDGCCRGDGGDGGPAACAAPARSSPAADACRSSGPQGGADQCRADAAAAAAACPICLERHRDLPSSKALALLPCGHEMCRGCAWGWLRDHATCPVCRWRFPDEDTHLIK